MGAEISSYFSFPHHSRSSFSAIIPNMGSNPNACMNGRYILYQASASAEGEEEDEFDDLNVLFKGGGERDLFTNDSTQQRDLSFLSFLLPFPTRLKIKD